MKVNLRDVWTDVRVFADTHRRLTLGIACFVVGFVVGKVL